MLAKLVEREVERNAHLFDERVRGSPFLRGRRRDRRRHRAMGVDLRHRSRESFRQRDLGPDGLIVPGFSSRLEPDDAPVDGKGGGARLLPGSDRGRIGAGRFRKERARHAIQPVASAATRITGIARNGSSPTDNAAAVHCLPASASCWPV